MEYLKELEQKFNSLILKFKDELASIRTNRPTPKLVESIKAEYAGSLLAINQLGSISVEPPRSIIITPANIGVGAAQQGNIIRVTLPEMTEERRQELIKLVGKTAEDTRIRMRVERDEINKIINKEADKDGKFRAKEALQKLVDKFNEEIEGIVEAKIREISM
ncbi:MAG: ribosome recycling factor [Candidatus Colwellbacteria bacterium]|nr:ribosome recycling factor [Candidatus Colwellbacteria bacterium]